MIFETPLWFNLEWANFWILTATLITSCFIAVFVYCYTKRQSENNIFLNLITLIFDSDKEIKSLKYEIKLAKTKKERQSLENSLTNTRFIYLNKLEFLCYSKKSKKINNKDFDEMWGSYLNGIFSNEEYGKILSENENIYKYIHKFK